MLKFYLLKKIISQGIFTQEITKKKEIAHNSI